MEHDERRQYQRLKLSKPILATLRSSNALILDISIGGAFVEHHGTMTTGERFNLSFTWKGEPVEFACEARRSIVVRAQSGAEPALSQTGIQFLEPVGDSAVRLREMIGSLLGRLLEAQKANASGEGGESAGATILARLGEARRQRSRGFVTWRLKEGEWQSTPSTSSRQPLDGFTVGEHEEDGDVATLRRTYEAADAEGRNLIRMTAELSASKET
jgi:hypothetical protein